MTLFFKLFVGTLTFFCFLDAQDNQIFIGSLNLEGNKNVSLNEVLLIVRQRPPSLFSRKTEFDSRLMRLDALTIKNYYFSKGFLDVNIDEDYTIQDQQSKNKYVDLLYKIEEGKQYFLSSIELSGNNLLPDSQIKDLLGLEINAPYNPVGLNDKLYLLENEYQKKGKVFSSISVSDKINETAKVKIDIEEGRSYYINNTIIKGIGNIDSSIVYRELDYKPGQLYSKTKIDNSLKKIREIGIFSTANITPIKTIDSDSLVNLIIQLRRYKQREWISSGGYEPFSFAEGAPELPAISGTIEWRNRAFLNSSKQFAVKLLFGIPVEVDFVTPRLRYDASLSSNWFFGYRFPTTFTGYFEKFIIYEEKDYKESIDRYGANMVQHIQLKGRSYFESKSLWENFGDASEENIQERSISLKLVYDIRDDPLFTKRGFLINFLYKFAGFGGSREYTKADLTIQSYQAIFKETVLAARLQFGNLWKWDSNYNDYSFEKFYLGGSTSMRGWEVLRFSENDQNEPNGETLRIMTNMEIRQKVYKSFGMTLFADGGLLSTSLPNNIINELKWDLGVGVTFDTPLGPLRLDYAAQVNDLNTRLINIGIQNLF
ncbi:MAG: hypothetical protein CMG60_02645 [Candidatus Marinimicrobia bacterium]|nr:hypothetical protein [Candidatus Neomarinimicrobiota bacterium]